MRWIKKEKKPVNREDWHSWFAWWPTRVQEDTIVWWEVVWRRIVVDDQGTWAGGFIYHWEYHLNELRAPVWAAPKVYS